MASVWVGAVLLVGAFSVAPVGVLDVALGLVVLPVATIVVLRLRGEDAAPLRWTGPLGHAANIAIAVALASVMLQPTLLFHGSAMLLAAEHGDAGCELLALGNLLTGRDDEIGCPVFSPIDAVERRVTRTPAG